MANFAFATQLGSGVYSVSGRTLQIYRLPFSYTLKSTEDSSVGVELTLPVTFGFYDFELQDIANGDIPTNVDALSFVPGLKFVFELQPGWKLEPYVEAGISRARDVDADASVYAGGLVSLYEFDGRGFDWLLRNDLTFAGVDVRGAAGSDQFTRLQTVLTARRPFSRRFECRLPGLCIERILRRPAQRAGRQHRAQRQLGPVRDWIYPGNDRDATPLAHSLATGRHRLPVRIAPGRVPNRDRDAVLTASMNRRLLSPAT